jgi:hypothetical protein
MAEYQEDDEVVAATTSNGLGSLLDHLGALREHRASETTTSLPLPGFEGRLWATYRLPDAAKATQVATMSAAGHQSLLGTCMDLLAATTTGLYTGPSDPDGKVHDEDGHLNSGYAHLPGGTDEMPVTFAHPALERIPQLCPARPGGREHTAETRVRALFGRDNLVVTAAMTVVGWALGGGDSTGALAELSESFVGE